MKKSFKPTCKIHFSYVFIYVGLVIFLIFDLRLILFGNLVAFLIAHIAQTIAFILIRIFYKVKYEIDDEYLTQYYGKEITFKIKKSDIEEVYVKKSRWFNVFYVFFSASLSLGSDPIDNIYGSNISFAFHTWETIRQPKTKSLRISLKPEDKKGSFEVSDFFSYRQSKKICKLLGKEPIMVKKATGYIKSNQI